MVETTQTSGAVGGDVPATMRAVITRVGGALDQEGALVDAEVPAPQQADGLDLLVRVSAVSVNPIDTKQRKAGSDDPERILGFDAVGTVVAAGASVSGFEPGDRVMYAGVHNRPGSNAEFQLVDSRIAAKAPESLSDKEAAALPLTTITAWEALFDKLRLTKESRGTLLILGAGGGVGSIMIQLAKRLTGVRVIASASRPESAAWVHELGADVVVDHSAPDFSDRILAEAPEGVDYVFATNTTDRTEFFTTVVRPFGEIVGVDNAVGIDLLALKGKSLTWHWESMFTRILFDREPERQGEAIARMAQMVDAGQLRTTLKEDFGPVNAENLRAAHRTLEEGHSLGKIVLGW